MQTQSMQAVFMQTIEDLRSTADRLEKLAKGQGKVKGKTLRVPNAEPPLYKLCFETLQSFGHPATAQMVAQKLKARTGKTIGHIYVYQALEYNRKHFGTVKRAEGGIWSIVGKPKANA
jgi:hypothetical protein